MTKTIAFLSFALIGLAAPSGVRAVDSEAEAPAKAPTRAAPATRPAAAVDPAAREKWFAELLTNATLVGSYTMGQDRAPKEDRYTILKAVKGEGDNWVITAKVEYKGFAIPVDITVPVRWAGDTPMIQLTDQKVPGLGTFSARVMFYGDQYAGVWSGGDHGGLMFGHVQRAGAKPATRPATGGGAKGTGTAQ